MSAQSSPSPHQAATPELDEANLPKGQCRYILLLPEIKGHRCACVNFSLNRSMPSATCDCGHLACFHVKSVEPTAEAQEMERLRQRVTELEEQLDLERPGGLGGLVGRMSSMEELVERSKDEIQQEVKGSYRQLTRIWQSVDQLEKKLASLEEGQNKQNQRLAAHDSDVQRLDNFTMELREAEEILEEKIEEMKSDPNRSASRGRRRRKSSSRARNTVSSRQTLPLHTLSAQAEPGSDDGPDATSATEPAPPLGPPHPSRRVPRCLPTGSWTVHVSLLPTASHPFPFEKDTNAYKRCLSRGLHQMVAIGGTDSESIESAVSKAFEGLLRGRPWMPLQAKLCDAETLQGLPMLRSLDQSLVNCKYDAAFLRDHCAVCDVNGKIESLYISMRNDTFSWHFLKRSPVWLAGLEASWAYDPLLDPNDPVFDDDQMDDDGRPPAGDIVQAFPLKRGASEMSRTSSFGSATASVESDGTRPKMARIRMPAIADGHRRVETKLRS